MNALYHSTRLEKHKRRVGLPTAIVNIGFERFLFCPVLEPIKTTIPVYRISRDASA